jgi:hypothetical protein
MIMWQSIYLGRPDRSSGTGFVSMIFAFKQSSVLVVYNAQGKMTDIVSSFV